MPTFSEQKSILIIRRIVELLAFGRFTEIEKIDRGKRVSADQLKVAVEQYGATLVPISADHPLELDIIEVTAAEMPTWSVIVPLYSLQEGRSDLCLSLAIIENEDASVEIEIEDLHVL